MPSTLSLLIPTAQKSDRKHLGRTFYAGIRSFWQRRLFDQSHRRCPRRWGFCPALPFPCQQQPSHEKQFQRRSQICLPHISHEQSHGRLWVGTLSSVIPRLHSLIPCKKKLLNFNFLVCRTDARTVSSGSSAWEGQFTSMVLSEYASTEMSIHALYMHEVAEGGHEYMVPTWTRFIVFFPKIPQRVHVVLFLETVSDCSCTSNNPAANCPGTRGTGRRAMKVVTASQTKSEVSPTLTPEISPARTLSRQWSPAPAVFLLPPQPVPVQASARKGRLHNQTPNAATADLPQVPYFFWIFQVSRSILVI